MMGKWIYNLDLVRGCFRSRGRIGLGHTPGGQHLWVWASSVPCSSADSDLVGGRLLCWRQVGSFNLGMSPRD